MVAFLKDPALEEQVRDQEQVRGLIGEVDFPSFVAELIKGVFEAIVSASIEQVKAYAELVKGIASSLHDFAAETEQTEDRDHLAGRYPPLATMVLMGINRIVVTDGKIKTKVRFDPAGSKDDSDDGRK